MWIVAMAIAQCVDQCCCCRKDIPVWFAIPLAILLAGVASLLVPITIAMWRDVRRDY